VPRAAPNKQKLAALTATKLRPGSRPYLVWDTYQRGLALQVQPSGYRAYKLIYRYHNRPRWYHLGAADAIALADARKLAAELMLEVIRGKDPAAEKRAARGTGTFAAIATRYVEDYARKRNKSWRQADALVRRHLLPAWGSLTSITRADVRTLMGKIDAPIVANQVLASASAIFTWAIKQELLTNNPCRGVERNATVSRERVLSDAEVPLFWKSFTDADLPGLALKVLLLTGQRPGEVTHMRFEHIAPDGWWHMPGLADPVTQWPGTKNSMSHAVWLVEPVRAIIAELNCDDGIGFVFGQPLDLTATMRNICKTLAITQAVRPHDLRRTFGTAVTALGFGRPSMHRLQNHRTGDAVGDIYDRHSYSAENKRVMESVAKYLLSLALGTDEPSNVTTLTKFLG
jgi:integrase